jgi:hypothetical protein
MHTALGAVLSDIYYFCVVWKSTVGGNLSQHPHSSRRCIICQPIFLRAAAVTASSSLIVVCSQVLSYGILTAAVLRAIMILLGAELIEVLDFSPMPPSFCCCGASCHRVLPFVPWCGIIWLLTFFLSARSSNQSC